MLSILDLRHPDDFRPMLEEWNDACPYCGEPISLTLDPSGGDQRYIEDCWVCCRPIEVTLDVSVRSLSVQLRRDDD